MANLSSLLKDAFTIYSESYNKIGELGVKVADLEGTPAQPKKINQLIEASSLFTLVSNSIVLSDDATSITNIIGDIATMNNLLLKLKKATGLYSLPAFPTPLTNIDFAFSDGGINIGSGSLGDLITNDGTDWVRLSKGADGTVLVSTPSGLQWQSVVGNGIPSGGSTGQYLRKNTNTNYDVGWDTLTPSDISGVTSSVAELNILTGVTVGATELNNLSGLNTNIITLLGGKQSTSLTNGKFLVGNGSNIATAVTPTGDVVFDNVGVFSYSPLSINDGDINTTAAITRSKMAMGSSYRMVVNNSAGVMTDASAITPDFLIVSDGNGLPITGSVSTATLAFVDPTSSIQTQLDNRLTVNLSSPVQGDMIYFNGTDWVNFAVGTAGQVITSNGTIPTWGSAAANGLPTGGSASQFLTKIDATNYNATWTTLTLSLVTDVSASASEVNILAGVTASTAEINTLVGMSVTPIQDQLNNKLDNNLAINAVWVGGGGNTAQQVSPGADNSVFTIVAGVPTWQTPPAPGNVSGPVSSTDNAVVRWNSTGGNSIKNSSVIIDNSDNISGLTSVTIKTAGGLRTSTSAGNTLLLQAYDVDGAAYTTFGTLTANNTPTFDLNTAVTINGAFIYRAGGTDVAVADGGTNISAYTAGDLLYATGATTLSKLAIGTNSYVLTVSGGVPTWQPPSAGAGTVTNFIFTNGGGFTGIVATSTSTPTLSLTYDLSPNTTTQLAEGINLYFTNERVDDRVAALIVAGLGITWTYNDVAGTLTSDVTITQYTDELAQDAVGNIFVDSTTIDFTYSDATPSITAIVIDNSISNGKIRQSSGLSVIGNATNSTANVTDIIAGTDGHVLRLSGTTLGFGTISTAGIGASQVTYAKIQNVTDGRLLGNASGGAAAPSEISVSGLTLSSGTLTASAATVGAWALTGTSTVTTPTITGNITFTGNQNISGIVGIGTTSPSATSLLQVGGSSAASDVDGLFQTRSSVNALSVSISHRGHINFGTAGAMFLGRTNTSVSPALSGNTFGFRNNSSWTGVGYYFQVNDQNAASGTQEAFKFDFQGGSGWFPTAGTATGKFFSITPVINTTGTYVGTFTGFDYNPSIVFTTGLTHYGILVRPTGALNGFGTGTPTSTLHTVGTVRFDLGSDATGDIFYRAATTGRLTRLGIGSTGYVLTVAGGLPSWAAPTSSSSGSIGDVQLADGSGGFITGDATISGGVIYLVDTGVNALQLNKSGSVSSLFRDLTIQASDSAGGTGTDGYNLKILGGNAIGSGIHQGGNIIINPGTKSSSGVDGNIALLSSTGSFGGGGKVISIANATTVPGSTPTGGGILYVESGVLKYKGSSGTVTPIAVA